jgi:precorrin-6B methylase 2
MLGGIRSEVFLAARLVSQDAPVAATWSPTDPAVLQAAGDVSAGFPGVLEHVIAPQLERLPERLAAADGAFLDVGVGIAAMSIEMARRWPSLRVVGVDPWPASIEAARHNVRKAGLVTRIELRTQRAEDLADTERFDLAWVPGLFISADALPSVLDRVRQALRPGGWMLLALAAPTADPLVAALARLRTALWGGTQATASEAQTLLTRFGLVAVRALSASRSLGIAIVAGQRAPIRPGSTERQLV